MKKEIIILLIVIIAIVGFSVFNKITGKAVGGPPGGGGSEDGMMMGPSDEDMACMVECTTRECDLNDMECRTAKSGNCGLECGVETEQPKPADEGEACMQKCVVKGCGNNYDFSCQRANLQSCEDECNMEGDAPDESEMSEEQKCITECVQAVDSTIICKSGSAEGEGEQGGSVCKKCAESCVHLYEGPCLIDEKWREIEDACMTQGEYMEAAPVMGDSGEGYKCTVDLECIDRSDEWGDEPGEGPGIGQEGYIAPNAFLGAVDNIIGFFKGLFGGGSENTK